MESQDKDKNDFKVVIAGGGIAGLALAKMLETYGLNYVLLEAHDQIAPAIGASIGLFPNGLVILDQLGLYDEILKVASPDAAETAHIRTSNGKSISMRTNFSEHMTARFGYPLIFFDRQYLLRILYDSLQHKSRVLLGKRVVEVSTGPSGAQVTTSDGGVYSGSIVIGADGVHSAVRSHMFTLEKEHDDDPKQKKRIEEQQSAATCDYQCAFGISRRVPGWVMGEQCFTTGKGTSWLVASGPDERVYWFLFHKLEGKTLRGKEIPRYSGEDEARFLRENRHLKITETVDLGTLVDSKISSTLTPLHEVVYKKWFFRRIGLIGDSCHKQNPIGGQGGNGALETCAEFINALLALKNRRGGLGLGNLTTGEVESVLREMQEARDKRARAMVSAAHKSQAIFAYENRLLSTAVWRVLAPLSGAKGTWDGFAPAMLPGSRIKGLQPAWLSRRPHAIPFDAELPAKPVTGWAGTAVRGLFAAGFGTALWFSDRLAPLSGLRGAATISPCVSGIYRLTQMLSPALLSTVEGYRIAGRGTLLSLPSLFLGAIPASQGTARPGLFLHGLASVLQLSPSPADRHVSTDVGRALLPSLAASCVLPALARKVVPNSVAGMMTSVAPWSRRLEGGLWIFAPLAFSTCTYVFSAAMAWRRRQQKQQQSKMNGHSSRITKGNNGQAPAPAPVRSMEDKEEDEDHPHNWYSKSDLPYLRAAYRAAGLLQGAAHLAACAYLFFNRGTAPLDIVKALVLTPEAAAVLGEGLWAVWSLRASGYITTLAAARAAAALAAGQVVVGSGAASAALWSWREGVVADLSTAGGK